MCLIMCNGCIQVKYKIKKIFFIKKLRKNNIFLNLFFAKIVTGLQMPQGHLERKQGIRKLLLFITQSIHNYDIKLS